MSQRSADRIAALEAEVAELRALLAPRRRTRGRYRAPRILVALGVMVALLIPAATFAGGQRFNDVPPSHAFFQAIEEVAAAGVTQGCGNGSNFCPSGLVNRGQMAAFMSRLGALSPGRTPVVNADKLDGLDSTAFSRAAYATVRPDQCFHGPGNWCQLSNARNIDHVEQTATGSYCVVPLAGQTFTGRTPVVSPSDGTNLVVGAPVFITMSPGPCDSGEVHVQAWAWNPDFDFELSDFISFGIVIP